MGDAVSILKMMKDGGPFLIALMIVILGLLFLLWQKEKNQKELASSIMENTKLLARAITLMEWAVSGKKGVAGD